MPSDSGSAWLPPASNSERRLSNSSDGSAGSCYSKATTDSADFLATRPHTASVLPGKPAANPLQFVKVGPADLGNRAREQLRKAELAKRTEPAHVETQEDWQSNLDNWKSSRRKRVEHIIERCVEVRRLETEPSQPRTKSKTFNEMLEKRAGRRRRNPLALYTDDDGNDLSDLGIGTSSTKSSLSEDCDTHSLASDGMDLDKCHSDTDNLSNCDNTRKRGSSANEYDTCTTTTISSPEPEEYTYEGAIEVYKSRIISQTTSNIVKTVVSNNSKEKSPEKNKSDLNNSRAPFKTEDTYQHDRSNDVKNNNGQKNTPKVDEHNRWEQTERENSQESQTSKQNTEIVNKKSIKERLSSLEKFNEEMQSTKSTSDLNKIPSEVKPLKERLFSLEKLKSSEPEKPRRLSNQDITNTKSVKERLFRLQAQTSDVETKIAKTEVKEVSMSLKERLSFLDAARQKEIPKHVVEEENEKIDQHVPYTDSITELEDNSSKSSMLDTENPTKSFGNTFNPSETNGQSSPYSSPRVQSSEDLDCYDTQHTSVRSYTEDSGIRTASDIIDDASTHTSSIAVGVTEYKRDANRIAKLIRIGQPNEIRILELKPVVDKTVGEDAKENKTDNSSTKESLIDVSQHDDCSATEDTATMQLDVEDEDTLKSLDNDDTSVMDALELAFEELDSNDSTLKHSSDTQNESSLLDETTMRGLDSEANISVDPNFFYRNSAEEVETFPLDLPPNVLEPPKEKPPPPPSEDAPEDDELLGNGSFKHANSARRIKKLIRNKRSNFLGIEDQVDDSYLDADLALAPRPDITSFLQEETKIDKLLYKRTLSHDMDSKIRESRDSGVDVDRGTTETWYRGQSSPDVSNTHSRQNSEPLTNITVTSDEEEGASKQNPETDETNKMSNPKENAPQLDESKIDSLDKKIQHQQASRTNEDWTDEHDDARNKEVLLFERELLQLEQEELRRQRDNLLRDQMRIMQKSVHDISTVPSTSEKPPIQNRPEKTINQNHNYRHSMPNLLVNEHYAPVPPVQEKERQVIDENLKRKPFVSEEHIQRHFGVEESRKILYEERGKAGEVRRLVPNTAWQQQPTIQPKLRSQDSVEREITMRSSRVPSAVDYANVDRAAVTHMRQKPVQHSANGSNGQYHPMTRHTLQALSAAPTPKLISNSEWIQARNRKSANYNYNQHWLIQEAELRRIEEHKNKMRQNQRHSFHQDVTQPTLLNMHPLSTSQQNLPQEFKRPLRPEPSRSDPPKEEKLLSVSGRRKCSHCGKELGRGAAMIIESLSLCYHVWCFTCAVCGTRLGDGRAGADVRVRGNRLHCHQCYSGDDGRKYSCV